MSDVFAMGGEVVLALNVLCFPSELDREIVAEILRGGAEKVRETGAMVAGGHTVDDREVKYGLSVMGLIHPDCVITKAGAQAGDFLALTKPLGTGVITTAFKRDAADLGHVEAAVRSMKKTNRGAAELIQKVGVHACTDITGYALLGHAHEMAAKSGVGLSLSVDKLPFLEGSIQYAEDLLFPGGTNRNMNYYKQDVDFSTGIPGEMKRLLFTPETSGGLLFSFAKEKLREITALFRKNFEKNGQTCWIIGEVTDGKGIQVDP